MREQITCRGITQKGHEPHKSDIVTVIYSDERDSVPLWLKPGIHTKPPLAIYITQSLCLSASFGLISSCFIAIRSFISTLFI